MSKPSAARPRIRRTQEERSTATRTLLLDATVECLIELGYSATTTTVIAERAGVSRGAQMHHYPTKAELMAAAVQHLAQRIATELSDDLSKDLRRRPPTSRAVAMASLDAIWKRYASPLFEAWVELWVAARTDDDLRTLLAPTEVQIRDSIRAGLAELLGPNVPDDRYGELWSLTFYLLQGMAF
ncbi:MAG TPA: TetR/AcrR family transcriptional regulator, partial [Microthrixaceae bacterium]|nr:TetR/AcrR family transcriptional regulator [Microthrixaceae bacterium]